jgi:hypothetical protein
MSKAKAPKFPILQKSARDAMEKHQNKFQTSNVIFETTINCFLASNQLAQFSRQNVVQILSVWSSDGVTKSLWEALSEEER